LWASCCRRLSGAHNSGNKVRNACEWIGALVKNSDKDDFVFLPAGETSFLFFKKPSGRLDNQGCLPYSQPLIIRDLLREKITINHT